MSEDDRDEREVLERFRRGEPEAFDALYEAFGPRLYRFGLRLCGNPADAEDLTQEVFAAAFQSLHRFEGRSSLATYLYRIAVYRWRESVKGCRLDTVRWDEQREEATDRMDPARVGVARMELHDALNTLSSAQRTAFLLVKAEGFSCRETAGMLGLPVGTVKYHVYEAVRRLQARLGSEGGPGAPAAAAAAVRRPQRRKEKPHAL